MKPNTIPNKTDEWAVRQLYGTMLPADMLAFLAALDMQARLDIAMAIRNCIERKVKAADHDKR